MSTTPRVGYVGLHHHHAEPYLASLAELPVSVTAACEPDPEFDPSTVDGLGDVPVYREPEDLLDGADVDLLWLTLPNRDAPAVIEAAIERDVDVYTEKPVARTAAELAPLRDSLARSNATVGVSYLWRGNPVAKDLRQRAANGYFGDVRAVDARFVASRIAFRDAEHFLFDRAASRGGIVQWLGVHFIDLLQWILDDSIERVNSAMKRGADVDVEDGATLQFETRSGVLGTLHTGHYLPEDRYDTRVAIYGTDGWSDWDPLGEEFRFDGDTVLEIESTGESGGAPRRSITYDYDPAPGYGGAPGLSFMREFLEARRREGISPPATLADAVDVLQVLDAAYESAAANEWVPVDPV